MLDEIVGVLFPVVLCGIAIVLARLYLNGMDKRWHKKENTLKKKYPEYYRLKAKRDGLCVDSAAWNSMKEAQKKIDSITKELPYLPQENLSSAQLNLERLRKQYLEAKYDYEKEQKEVEKLHKEMMDFYHQTPELIKFYRWAE